MIDFHTHILPNIDDGSESVEETFDLLKEAENAGFDSIISTSHYIEGYYEETSAKRQAWLEAISKNLYKKDIKLNLYLGSEVYISENIANLLLTGKASTIHNSNYVLFEFPLATKPMNIYEAIYNMQDRRYIPILAHPERYSFIQQNPDLVYDLIQNGVLMQANFGSVIGLYGEKAEVIVKRLIENDMVHFLGSDVHRRKTIYPHMPEIIKELEFIIGKDKLKELTTINPNLVLINERIEVNEPRKFKLNLKDRRILKN